MPSKSRSPEVHEQEEYGVLPRKTPFSVTLSMGADSCHSGRGKVW